MQLSYSELLDISNDAVSFINTLDRDIFNMNALWLNDVWQIIFKKNKIGVANSLPIPVLAFYHKPSPPEFINKKYSEYPSLQRKTLTNNSISEPLKITTRLYSPYCTLNKFNLAQIKMNVFTSLLEEYINNGGSFSVLTTWGYITDLYCTSFRGVSEDGTTDGQVFELELSKYYVTETAIPNVTSVTVNAIKKGLM